MRSRNVACAFAIAMAVLLPGCFGFGGPGPKDFVSDARYRSMLIEVLYAEGAPPRDSAIELLVQRANERLSKPDGVEVKQKAYDGESKRWSSRDLRNLLDDVAEERSSGSRVVLHVLYVRGGSDQDTDRGRVLGVFFENGAVAIFPDNIDGGGLLGAFGAADVERAVLVHEFGHAIGLVNLGIPMQNDHEDDEHPKHSDNSQSVMYWAVENTLGLAGLTGSLPTNFDADDRADLQAAGGK